LVVTAPYSTLKVWDLHEKKILLDIPASSEKYDISSFVLTPSGKFVVAGLLF